jgi:hypothetical protein
VSVEFWSMFWGSFCGSSVTILAVDAAKWAWGKHKARRFMRKAERGELK